MSYRRISSLLAILVLLGGLGCIGFNPFPEVFKMKPWTLFSEGDQLGRDQLANRFLIAKKLIPLKGLDQNQVLTILGQPQEIEIKERNISEDWYFVYYKRYKSWPKTDKGVFMVRFYHEEVIDVVSVS